MLLLGRFIDQRERVRLLGSQQTHCIHRCVLALVLRRALVQPLWGRVPGSHQPYWTPLIGLDTEVSVGVEGVTHAYATLS